jgi:cell division protein FtsL
MLSKKRSVLATSEKTKGALKKLTNYGILVVLAFLCLSLVRSVNRTRRAMSEIAEVQKRVDNLRQENEEMERRLEEESSGEFIEKQLRDKLNMAKNGEIVVVLPDPEIVKKFAPKVEEEHLNLPDPNWKKWMKLFF